MEINTLVAGTGASLRPRIAAPGTTAVGIDAVASGTDARGTDARGAAAAALVADHASFRIASTHPLPSITG